MTGTEKRWGDLSGKIAIVTAGSRGLGRDMARALRDGGAKVMITGRDQDALEKTQAQLGDAIAICAGDASDEKHVRDCVQKTMERFGSIDILVNNAGRTAKDCQLVDLKIEDFDYPWQLNVRGTLLWVQACWSAWMKDHGGVVINIASAGGLSVPPGMGAYATSKAALLHLTRCLAAELGPKVRVNALSPGLTRSDGIADMIDKLAPVIAPTLPLERLGEPEDMAEIVRFLASDLSSWMTGENILVDGGSAVSRGKQRGFRTQSDDKAPNAKL